MYGKQVQDCPKDFFVCRDSWDEQLDKGPKKSSWGRERSVVTKPGLPISFGRQLQHDRPALQLCQQAGIGCNSSIPLHQEKAQGDVTLLLNPPSRPRQNALGNGRWQNTAPLVPRWGHPKTCPPLPGLPQTPPGVEPSFKRSLAHITAEQLNGGMHCPGRVSNCLVSAQAEKSPGIQPRDNLVLRQLAQKFWADVDSEYGSNSNKATKLHKESGHDKPLALGLKMVRSTPGRGWLVQKTMKNGFFVTWSWGQGGDQKSHEPEGLLRG